MREMTNVLFRGFCLAAVLTAGSCTGSGDDKMTLDDPRDNHPIMVEPLTQSLHVSASAGGIAPAEMGRFYAFVSNYQAHGNGKIVISAPDGAEANDEVAWIADRINAMGVSRDQILVANHDVTPGDDRVELNYVTYQANTAPCGDWSEDLAYTLDNKTAANFGCSVQHNVAAMVSDPRDLMSPRPMDGSDANRRATVLTNYEKGAPTGAAMTADQKSAISEVGK
ncbi:MAG TPA: CpaD family pilus assembly protein [Rhizomicrobium sp.]|nr:CpaD family pilus assembly protein [Rhizomicrobium sp.]